MFFFAVSKPLVMGVHGSASNGKQWRALARELDGAVTFIAPTCPALGTWRLSQSLSG